ncbi:hypothetical protein [Xenorhabdus sp. PB30.3]|uniref:hypothetical protein n=1 Tax=Xenorhabdus sp. PB30.3 TaxID=2788941 RepID=UPI001E4524CC|nr:hypothetical protein [Xenorhabdus sp. PB30.3]MCC8381284.1 hypothetical protein [Xenorhabdus sp. PB30.3]
MFEALNKIDSDKFENLYKELESMPQVWHKPEANKPETNEAILKFVASINVWFNSNISTLLNSSSDEAVKSYGRHLIRSLNILLKNDPTGIQCFNVLYPGVIGELDVFKIKDDIKGIAYERNYLNNIADSIARHDKVDRLPADQIEEALSIINNKLVEKYGDYYYIEDPKELSNQPVLACGKILDLYENIMELAPHLSAEILRYMNEPE